MLIAFSVAPSGVPSDGAERSDNQHGRAISVYAIARKPAAKVALAAMLGLGAAALAVRHQTKGEAE